MEKNKVFVITGASGGMGRVLVRRMMNRGVKLAICSNDAKGLELLEQELTEQNCDFISRVVNVCEEEEVSAFLESAAEKYGKLDYLINFAGLSIPNQYEDTAIDVFDTMMDVNVKGTFLFSKHYAKYANDPGLIINVGSMAARNTNANAPIYCMAKAAVNKLSDGLLLQLGKKNIRVTTINPGGADTPFWGERKIDRSKLMQPEDVVNVMEFVISSSPNVEIHCIDFESMEKFK